MPIGISTEINTRRETFFRLAFGQARGYACIATLSVDKKFREDFFSYPDEIGAMLEHINKVYPSSNVYFCPQLFNTRRRAKDTVTPCPSAWSDLDTCDPGNLLVEPTLTLETSPNRFQALWCFDEPKLPEEAEELSRRIAYHHAPQGADRSGWDLTQLLRVPITYNLKYAMGAVEAPTVQIIQAKKSLYRISDFNEYPQAQGFQYLDVPFPEELPDTTADDILEKHRRTLNPIVWALFQVKPEGEWSTALFKLEMSLFESGMSREEVYIVCNEAACNKYQRDGRPYALWKDVLRAASKHEEHLNIVFPPDYVPEPLMTDEERELAMATPTFVERYIEWAKSLGDAAWQYHQAGAFIALSSLLAGTVRLPTSFGTILPNLWFMILADTTLTRKSTAMDIAMDLVMELDSDAVLATDGSIEGLLTSLSTRPGRPSIFLRDEFSGLLEAISKKDYYAGMAEMLTKLYDGKMQKRILRKEVIEVREPVLILFAGGIRNKILSLLNTEFVSSGFMPRFIYITAESDVTRLKPLGPPTDFNVGNRQAIKDELKDMHAHYSISTTVTINDNVVLMPKRWDAKLTDDAWVRYNKFEAQMLQDGMNSERPDMMTPTYDRLAKSVLKAATLLATARQRPEDYVEVDMVDLLCAIRYAEAWRGYAVEVMNGVGQGVQERQLQSIFTAINGRDGMTRSTLMQNYHLHARDTDIILTTLEQRGLITRQKAGRTEYLYSTSKKGA